MLLSWYSFPPPRALSLPVCHLESFLITQFVTLTLSACNGRRMLNFDISFIFSGSWIWIIPYSLAVYPLRTFCTLNSQSPVTKVVFVTWLVRELTTISRRRPTVMAPGRDVPWWTNTVGAISVTPFPNVFLRGQTTPVLALWASMVPRVAKVSPKLDISRGFCVRVRIWWFKWCVQGS